VLETGRQLSVSDANEYLIEDDVVRNLHALEFLETLGETTRNIAAAVDEIGDARTPE
jgi:hypothetical protein